MIYFTLIFMETFFSIFVWIWFFVFVDFVFDFVTFWYLFYFVKCKCGRMFASPLWKSLLFLTHSSWRFSWVFYLVFYHFDIILFTLIYLYTRACSGISCSCVPGFAETSYLTFIAIQLTGCHAMQDLGVGNHEIISGVCFSLT